MYEFDVTGLNAFQVFEGIDKDLRGQRLNLYQKKDLLKKAHDKNRRQLDIEVNAYQVRHNTMIAPDVDYNNSLKTLEKDLIERKSSDKVKAEKVENVKEELKAAEDNLKYRKNQNNELQNKITALQKELVMVCSDIVQGESKLKKLKIDLENAQREKLTNPEQILKLENEIENIKQKITLQKRLKDIDLQKKEADESVADWQAMNDIIQKDLELFKNEKLKPLLSKVSGLTYEKGKLRLDGKSIDELSGSEVVELGVNLLSLRSEGTLICINEAECLDDDTIGKIKWDDKKDFILIRVADQATKNKGFKSVKIEKKVPIVGTPLVNDKPASDDDIDHYRNMLKYKDDLKN